jgi:hypothetical protein
VAEAPKSLDKRTTREKHFDALYDAFKAFYTEALKVAKAPHEKARLEMTTVFFDDLELLKHVRPVFEAGVSNVEERTRRPCGSSNPLKNVVWITRLCLRLP